MKAGIYTARAGEADYGYLDAMVAAGDAVFLGERFDVEGRKHIAIEVPPRGKKVRRNPAARGAIRIGHEFFSAAIKDYADWREKWWREAVQNSVDAGATKISCIVDERGDSILVACEDNGAGMDEETILDKFLVLGATTKTLGTTTGGFGKAKELLLLPWMRWSIQSGNVLVEGEGAEYGVTHTDEVVKGTRIIVHMPPGEATHEAAAMAFIGKCYLPGVRFTVNDEPAKAGLKPGELVKDFDGKAAIYYDKRKSDYNEMLIRANGLYMFQQYVSSNVPGTLVVELLRPSIELLSANRDGFRDTDLRWEMRKFSDRLATDATQELKSKKGLIRKKFKGQGKFTAASAKTLAAALLETMGPMLPRGRGSGRRRGRDLVLSKEQEREIDRILAEMAGWEQSERSVPEWGSGGYEDQPAPPINFRVSPELAKAMLEGTAIDGTSHMEAIAAQLAWEPDFYLYNNNEGWKVSKRFFPATMAPNIRKLLRFWAELCRFILIALGSERKYGVGFVFEQETGGMHVDEEGDDWLLLNPFADTHTSGRVFSLGKKEDVDIIFATAIHEVTHMADGIDYHGDSYSSALTRNIAKLRRTTRQVERIRKACASRGPSVGPRLKSTKVAEAVLVELHKQFGRGITLDTIRANMPYVSQPKAYDLAVMEKIGLVRSRWDEANDVTLYWDTDEGFNWMSERVEKRERTARKKRTA